MERAVFGYKYRGVRWNAHENSLSYADDCNLKVCPKTCKWELRTGNLIWTVSCNSHLGWRLTGIAGLKRGSCGLKRGTCRGCLPHMSDLKVLATTDCRPVLDMDHMVA